MTRLTEVTVEQLRRALDDVNGSKPTLRLTAAIAYMNGVSQTELAEWFGVSRRTIYGWLTRLEEKPIAEAVHDDPRPGRPGKLSTAQRSRLETRLQEPPTRAGYDEPAWTPSLVREYLVERFDVAYSRSSCRRLMKEAGLVYLEPEGSAETMAETSRPDVGGGDPATSGLWLPS